MLGACLSLHAGAGRAATPTACARPAAGSVVAPAPDLYSADGVLNVTLDYITSIDGANRTLFCYVTPDRLEAPTLHVRPGDTLNITLVNLEPPLPSGAMRERMSVESNVCGSPTMDATSVNLHYHGTNTSPQCHSDEVVHTLVNAGQTFNYSIVFPPDEPPGLYWYHAHVHGIAESAVQGGASGAIIVQGIENLQPAVAGLPERILLIRDQNVAGNPTPGGAVPSWDLSLNYVPIAYPALTPAVIQLSGSPRELWRVANASADTVMDVQLLYDGVPQPLAVVGLDGVPTGSQDGTRRGTPVSRTDILIPTAGRAEFIINAPPPWVHRAILQTLSIDTGPDGDNDTTRTLAVLRQGGGPRPGHALAALPRPSGAPGRQRFEGLDAAPVTAFRDLYFSEVLSDPSSPASPTNFYITVNGATPTLFSPDNPPAITTTQGSVEVWTIENRTQEVHEFHIHQIHFELLAISGVPVPPDQRQFYDTYQVPCWSGSGPYPSITVKLDFRGNITGDFVYHCHILGHEDGGMMAIIRVVPPAPKANRG